MSGHKLALIAGLFLTGLMCLYPPFLCVGISAEEELALSEGYYSIFSLPQDQHFNTGRSQYTIAYRADFDRLYGQAIFIGLISVGVATVLYTRTHGQV